MIPAVLTLLDAAATGIMKASSSTAADIEVTYDLGDVQFPKTLDSPVQFPKTASLGDVQLPKTDDRPVQLS